MEIKSVPQNVEMAQVIRSVSRQLCIPSEDVFEAMEKAIEVASARKYGDLNIGVEIDRDTGETRVYRILAVVDSVEDNKTQIDLNSAQVTDKDAEIGSSIRELLPPIDLKRVAAMSAKHVIVEKITEAEKRKEYEEYCDKVGEILSNCIVERIESNNIIVKVDGKTEALLHSSDIIPGENFRQGERLKAYIKDIKRETKKIPQVILSRTCNEFMEQLFVQEVPEIYDGIIKIKKVARDPGSRAKIAVYSEDRNIDPVGSCVGVRGSRVQSVISELNGEKIDIVVWSADPAKFVVNALAPVTISRIVIDEEGNRIEIVVPDDQLSQTIGRKGQNIKLASQLVGWQIDALTEEQDSKRRLEEFNQASKLLVDELDIEEVMANLLVSEGYTSLERLSETPIEDLAKIEGFDEDLAAALLERVQLCLQDREQK